MSKKSINNRGLPDYQKSPRGLPETGIGGGASWNILSSSFHLLAPVEWSLPYPGVRWASAFVSL